MYVVVNGGFHTWKHAHGVWKRCIGVQGRLQRRAVHFFHTGTASIEGVVIVGREVFLFFDKSVNLKMMVGLLKTDVILG